MKPSVQRILGEGTGWGDQGPNCRVWDTGLSEQIQTVTLGGQATAQPSGSEI